jgi:hypothetical protein
MHKSNSSRPHNATTKPTELRNTAYLSNKMRKSSPHSMVNFVRPYVCYLHLLAHTHNRCIVYKCTDCVHIGCARGYLRSFKLIVIRSYVRSTKNLHFAWEQQTQARSTWVERGTLRSSNLIENTTLFSVRMVKLKRLLNGPNKSSLFCKRVQEPCRRGSLYVQG